MWRRLRAMWPYATQFSRKYRSYGRSHCCTWTRWRSSNGRNRTSSSRLSTRSSSASIAERATRRGTSSRRCRAERSANSVSDLARSRWVRPSRKRDTRRSHGPGNWKWRRFLGRIREPARMRTISMTKDEVTWVSTDRSIVSTVRLVAKWLKKKGYCFYWEQRDRSNANYGNRLHYISFTSLRTGDSCF